MPGSKLGRAINYALKHQETFEHVLLDGRLELSNNKAERAVKSMGDGTQELAVLAKFCRCTDERHHFELD